MGLGIEGRVAFVTGDSRGLGRIVAASLAAVGCKVAMAASSEREIDVAVEDIVAAASGEAMGVRADISDRDQVERAVAAVRSRWGDPLIVIGQTRHNVPGDFADITELDHYVESFQSYTMSTLHLLHAVLPGMQAAGWRRFVHIGSATAKEPEGAIHHVIANTTRPSTVGLLKTVSDEYARHGITVNTVAPGWIATENMYQYLEKNLGLTSEEAIRDFMINRAGVPAGRAGGRESPRRSRRRSCTGARRAPASSPATGSRSTAASAARPSDRYRSGGQRTTRS
jgi:3-oxoacyl-[acyl-carrier protein] reductase